MSRDTAIVNGRTRLYGTIGDPIEHVKSPEALTAAFRAAGFNALVAPLLAPSESLETVIRGLKAIGNFDGLVVTLPHKAAATAFVDHLGSAAARIGAINAMRRNPDGSWTGDMFDGAGLVRALEDRHAEIQGARVLLLGAGGAGGAMADAIAEKGVSSLTIFDRDPIKADALARRIQRHGVPTRTARPGAPDYDVIVNATPVGMKAGDRPLIDVDALRASQVVVDIAIAPDATTVLLEGARAAGCLAIDGRAVVDGQVAALLRFFHDVRGGLV